MARSKQNPLQIGVYVLELEKPMGTAKHSARLYVGSTKNLEGRLYYHRSGRGAHFTRAAVERGINFHVALFIPTATEAEARKLEQEIKARKNTAAWVKAYQRRNCQQQAVAQ